MQDGRDLTPRELIVNGTLAIGFLLALALFLALCGRDTATLEPGEPGTGVTVARPPTPIFDGPGDGTVLVADSTGALTPIRPAIPFDPDGAISIPGTGEPVLVFVEPSDPGWFPEFFPGRPTVDVAVTDAEGVPLPDSVGAIYTVQPRAIVELRTAVIGSFDFALSGEGEGALGASLSLSPVRVWGFRPDLGLRATYADSSASTGTLGPVAIRATLGVSVEPRDRLRIRVSSSAPFGGDGFYLGIGYRF